MNSHKIINVGVVCNGISYNSYLIKADKNVLIDTVPKQCADLLINNISKYISISDLDTIILNHTECDRSGALEALLDLNHNIEILASLSGLKNLEQQLNCTFNQMLAKSNMMYNVSDNLTLKFIITHNINWPDSMMTYCVENKIIFSCDAFSYENESRKDYFFEKLYPMREYVNNAMQQLKNIDILKIYPGSGDEIDDISIIDDYIAWSSIYENSGITILFESHCGNTEILANHAKDFLDNAGCDVSLIDISTTIDSDIYKSIYASKGVIFATPTHYRNIPKRMSSVIMGINHYMIKDTIFAVFGSYGWSGEAPNLVYAILKARHFNIYKSAFRVMFRPTSADFDEFDKYLSDFSKSLS